MQTLYAINLDRYVDDEHMGVRQIRLQGKSKSFII